jgi:NAD(P)H-dependent flavin oxidoreductase YrpB (nitropropane dioxygenase family)
VAIAAARAGALGLVDLEWEPSSAFDGVLSRAAMLGVDFGVRVRASDLPDAATLATWPSHVTVVCLVDDDSPLHAMVSRVQGAGRTAIVEVTDRDRAREGLAAGARAIVLAGHEAGGRCSDDSSLILLQAVAEMAVDRVWVRGGIGPDSAAACIAAGAAGVVLDGALLLARESPLEDADRAAIEKLDGSDTVTHRDVGSRLVRVLCPVANRRDANARVSPGWRGDAWRPVGQDAAFARSLAERFVTVGGIIGAINEGIDRAIAGAERLRSLAQGSPLAVAHGTEFPIVQGPMTRVSDTPAFAEAVAAGGGLPFLALAMLRRPEAARLID